MNNVKYSFKYNFNAPVEIKIPKSMKDSNILSSVALIDPQINAKDVVCQYTYDNGLSYVLVKSEDYIILWSNRRIKELSPNLYEFQILEKN